MIGRSVSKTTFTKILVQVAPELFLDASYAIALSSATDRHHQRAVELSSQVEADNSDLVTTRAVTLEIGNALSGLRYRAAPWLCWTPSKTILPSKSSRFRKTCTHEAWNCTADTRTRSGA